MAKVSIRTLLTMTPAEQTDAAWYDWFCKDTSLPRKTVDLVRRVKALTGSKKINQDTMYVFFKNNCPVNGSLFDQFSICDLDTGKVIYCVVPAAGYDGDQQGQAQLWGKENEFVAPIVAGTYADVKKFLLA